MSIDELKQVLALGKEYGAASIHWGSFKIAFKDSAQPEAIETSQSPAPDLAADDTANMDEIRFHSSTNSSMPLMGDD